MKKMLFFVLFSACAPIAQEQDAPPQKVEKQTETVEYSTISDKSYNAQKDYLKRFAQLAVLERRKYGIPASVILAVACRQSNAGHHFSVKTANNHFRLPHFDCIWYKNTAKIERVNLRNYENAWESFRDFSIVFFYIYYSNL